MTNPFYAGVLVWNGQVYPGKHEPVVSLEQFEAVQSRFGRPRKARPQKKVFVFTGMLRCGACGLAVTAEDKVNRHGSRYTYYHCTRRNLDIRRCRQPSIQAADLEAQIVRFLESLRMPDTQHLWMVKQVRSMNPSRHADEKLRLRSLEQAHTDVIKSLDTLTDLRLRDMIDDDDFRRKRAELQQEQLKLRQQLDRSAADQVAFEPLTDFILFSRRAADWFRAGTPEIKRLIFKTTGSNPTLRDKILSVEATKPFSLFVGDLSFPQLRAVVKDVRTLSATDEYLETLKNIKHLTELHRDDDSPQREAA